MEDIEQVEDKTGGGKSKKLIVAGVIAMVVVLAALAAWCLRGGEEQRDEPLFIRALRSVVHAQQAYKDEHGTYGTMEQLKEAGVIDRTLATAIAPDCRPWYLFTMEVEGDKFWTCVARPARWGVDGKQNAFITIDGVVYVNNKENNSEWNKKYGE